MTASSFDSIASYAGATGLNTADIFNNASAVQAFSDTAVAEAFANPNFSTSPNIPDFGGDLLASPASGANAQSFTFVTAPSDVSYSQGAVVEQVNIFGSNNPPLTVGSLNSGELVLGDALMEGFVLGKQVLQPIQDFYKMQEVTLNSEDGFVSVPVYTVYAGQSVGSGRTYGNYVIENIEVSEEMRDLTGATTRARVNVSFREVADYQINTGRDQALSSSTDAPQQAAQQAANVAQANTAKNTPAASPAAAAAASSGGGGGGGGGGGTQSSPTATAAAPGSRLIGNR